MDIQTFYWLSSTWMGLRSRTSSLTRNATSKSAQPKLLEPKEGPSTSCTTSTKRYWTDFRTWSIRCFSISTRTAWWTFSSWEDQVSRYLRSTTTLPRTPSTSSPDSSLTLLSGPQPLRYLSAACSQTSRTTNSLWWPLKQAKQLTKPFKCPFLTSVSADQITLWSHTQ